MPIFFVEKIWEAFAASLIFFSKKFQCIWLQRCFEQLAPVGQVVLFMFPGCRVELTLHVFVCHNSFLTCGLFLHHHHHLTHWFQMTKILLKEPKTSYGHLVSQKRAFITWQNYWNCTFFWLYGKYYLGAVISLLLSCALGMQFLFPAPPILLMYLYLYR